MKILQVNKYYYPHIGGIENHVRDVVQVIKDNVDLSVLVANEEFSCKEEIADGVQVIKIPRYFKISSAPVANFSKYIRKIPADIYHLHFPNPAGEIGYFLARPEGKLVITYHSDIVRQKLLLKLFGPFVKRILHKADKILVSSPNIIASSPYLSEVKDKCEVIPFSINVDRFLEYDESEVQKIRGNSKKPILLFVGRFIYYKGLSYLLDAVKNMDIKLILIGSGPLKETLIQQAKELGILDKIFFVSGISDKMLVNYYHACDIFVLPSIAPSEAFGFVQLEAHACGKPVVSTNLPTGVPYANLNGVTGLIVEPCSKTELTEAINRLLKDDNLRTRLGQQGKKRVLKEFNLEAMGEKILEIYRDLLVTS